MDRFLLVYRGAPDGSTQSVQHDLRRWDGWFDSLGDRILDRGSLSHASVDIDTRLAGPKASSSSLSGYSVLAASDFNEAVALAQQCPIFDEHGSLEIAHLAS
ncbi:hypothetical protein ACHMW6_17795 [Pseudoduganella sp. UC29_106]|uniref:hypothetical protein n=1 Tax=Pseudoduganella sp. UC29_106 TaxID=3374553 RepID=UPI0037578C25